MPLKAIYMTILIEWLAENNALIDCNNDFVAPLARAVAVEHHKEEARHIEYYMIEKLQEFGLKSV